MSTKSISHKASLFTGFAIILALAASVLAPSASADSYDKSWRVNRQEMRQDRRENRQEKRQERRLQRATHRINRVEHRELRAWDRFDQNKQHRINQVQRIINSQNRVQDKYNLGVEDSIVDQLSERSQFSTLVAAVDAAGLVPTLDGTGEFTVFAPTNQAFAKLLSDLNVTAAELLTNPALGDILTYHVLGLSADAATALSLDGQSVATVNGQNIAINVRDGALFINDSQVIVTNIRAANGIIHVIDTVLLP